MFEIKVTVSNPQERERAEYAQQHIEQFCYGLNGAYLTILDGEVCAFDAPAKYDWHPELISLYNYIFSPDESD
jgi:hypothetical protein